ncbi:MAG: dephospho-CoA kinase, partial [Nitratireductor sp.]
MIIIGLTGSIGMGKTTTAKFFADAGIPVQNADEVVHVLYQGDGAALIEEAFPNTVINGKVDRQALGKKVLGNKAALKQLENIVHPLVQKAREEFIEEHKAKKTPMVLLDIPLLFETGLDKHCDVIVVVS